VDAATTADAATPVEVLSEPTADVLTVGARGTAEPTQEIAIVAEDTWRAVAATQVVPAAAASAGVAAQASTAVAATVAEVPTEEAATATEVPTAAVMADTGNPRSLVRAKRSDLRVRPFFFNRAPHSTGKSPQWRNARFLEHWRGTPIREVKRGQVRFGLRIVSDRDAPGVAWRPIPSVTPV
jgi:hypothetical protein